MGSFLRRLFRLSLLLLLAMAGLFIELLVFPLLSSQVRRRVIRDWSRALLRTCGLRLQAHFVGPAAGAMQDAGRQDAGREDAPARRALEEQAPGRLLVANHTSWLDIFAINALATSAFVAKAELRRWPLAGWLIALAGTVFIERARRHAVHQVIQQLRERIRSGFPVAVFPEATTSIDPALLPFHANLLQAAIAENTAIVPLAIRYLDADGMPSREAAYVGDSTFIESLWTVLGARGLVVSVGLMDLVPAEGRNRHELARELRALISSALGSPTPDTSPGTAAASPGASR
jgi:1-acyl-sn-glycerol-3-phosphate acyltransferase